MGSQFVTHDTVQPNLLGTKMYFCYIKQSHKEMLLFCCMSTKPAMKVIFEEEFPNARAVTRSLR
jgi:hypothetical protein